MVRTERHGQAQLAVGRSGELGGARGGCGAAGQGVILAGDHALRQFCFSCLMQSIAQVDAAGHQGFVDLLRRFQRAQAVGLFEDIGVSLGRLAPGVVAADHGVGILRVGSQQFPVEFFNGFAPQGVGLLVGVQLVRFSGRSRDQGVRLGEERLVGFAQAQGIFSLVGSPGGQRADAGSPGNGFFLIIYDFLADQADDRLGDDGIQHRRVDGVIHHSVVVYLFVDLVILVHLVAEVEDLAVTGIQQRDDSEHTAVFLLQCILDGDIVQRIGAGVGDGDIVGDGLVDPVFAVMGSRARFLLDHGQAERHPSVFRITGRNGDGVAGVGQAPVSEIALRCAGIVNGSLVSVGILDRIFKLNCVREVRIHCLIIRDGGSRFIRPIERIIYFHVIQGDAVRIGYVNDESNLLPRDVIRSVQRIEVIVLIEANDRNFLGLIQRRFDDVRLHRVGFIVQVVQAFGLVVQDGAGKIIFSDRVVKVDRPCIMRRQGRNLADQRNLGLFEDRIEQDRLDDFFIIVVGDFDAVMDGFAQLIA